MKYTRITLYGIPNCDTVKKARTWLTDQGFEYVFHDFKKQGLPEKALNSWLKALDWEPWSTAKAPVGESSVPMSKPA